MEAVHMTGTCAHALANTIKSLKREDGTFDLVDIRQHNLVEHDTSMTRLDFRQGDNYTMQPYSEFSLILPVSPIRGYIDTATTYLNITQCCKP
jgi:hypothetical protein